MKMMEAVRAKPGNPNTSVYSIPATLETAIKIIRSLRKPFADRGWSISLFGSTLWNGQGRDIDIVAVPVMYSPSDPKAMMDTLFGVKDDPYCGLMHTYAWRFETSTGILDIQFRLPKHWLAS